MEQQNALLDGPLSQGPQDPGILPVDQTLQPQAGPSHPQPMGAQEPKLQLKVLICNV